MNSLPVVILAGRPSSRDQLMEYANVNNKVLIEYKNKKLLQIVIDAVIPIASSLLIVGIDSSHIAMPPVAIPVEFLSMEGEQYDKIFAAITYLHERPQLFLKQRHALFLSGDLPLIRSDVVSEFLQQCDPQFDFFYSLVPEATFLEQVPTLKWTYMKIKDGSFASGNLILLDPTKVVDKYDMIKFLSTNRKSFALGVFRASPYLFFKLLFGRIILTDAERLMTKIFKITSKLVIMHHFEVAFDLDLPEHLDWLLSTSQAQK